MIITSRLDNDLYNFLMSQVIWQTWPHLRVRYAFRNRTFAVPLGNCLDLAALREEFDHVRQLRFTREEIDYLRQLGYFSDGYLDWLSAHPALPEIELGVDNGHLVATFEGSWAQAVFWETPLLAIISQSYYRRFDASTVEGERRLAAKIDYLRGYPNLRFMEFGTRRRYSRQWQGWVLAELLDNVPANVLGTSNAALAKDFEIQPLGTMAHQLFMVTTAVFAHDDPSEDIMAHAANQVLDNWELTYTHHPHLWVMLPDTYGTLRFLNWLDPFRLERWRGVRQDSGDPLHVGEQIVAYYRRHGHDPAEHLLVPSDGLDLRMMSLLYERFADRIDVAFGWGTNLTNDLGFESLSLVVKPDSAVLLDGTRIPCVKLSDNLAKATGDPAAIAAYKAALGINGNAYTEEVRY